MHVIFYYSNRVIENVSNTEDEDEKGKALNITTTDSVSKMTSAKNSQQTIAKNEQFSIENIPNEWT